MIIPVLPNPGVAQPWLMRSLTGAKRLFKKYTIFFGVCVLTTSVASHADDIGTVPSPLAAALQNWPASCAAASAVTSEQQALVQGFYAQRSFLTVWNAPDRLDSLLLELLELEDDGLNPAHYQLDAIRQINPPSTPEQQLCIELLASVGYLQALHDLQHGRLAQQQYEPLWQAQPAPAADPATTVLLAEQGLANLPVTFAQARPALAQYQHLRSAYQANRRQALPIWPALPNGPLLRPGMQDERIPLLQQRLSAEAYLPAAPPANEAALSYSPELVAAVKAFQSDHALQADGLIGAGTLSELNISPLARRDQLKVNLERWRWLAHELEANMLLVDIAGQRLTYFQQNQALWQTRVIVGRPSRPTPLLKSTVNRLTLNPTWTVPPTIYRKDKLPEIRRDIAFLKSHDLQVLDREGKSLDPEQIDWDNPGSIMLRQSAGPKNPLGELVLRFANPFSVYLHDTPNRELFAKAPRALSSGCVRVEGVTQVLDLLLDEAHRLSVEAKLASGKTSEYRLPQSLPILMAYWTAEASANGQALYRPDVYGHDAKLLAALQTATR